MSNYDCPRCHSNQTTSFNAIYEQGTRANYGSSGGSSVSQTVLAQHVSPPTKPVLGCGMLTFLIAAPTLFSLFAIGFLKTFLSALNPAVSEAVSGEMLFCLYLALVVAGIAGGFYLEIRSINRRLPAYHTELREWALGMYCRRCANVWRRNH